MRPDAYEGLRELIESPLLVDVVLAFMAVEWIALTLYRAWMRRGLRPLDIAVVLAPGAAILIAMRGAVTGAESHWIAACLVAAGIAHGVDLVRRYRNGGGVAH